MITTSVLRVPLAWPGTDTTTEVYVPKRARESRRRPVVDADRVRAPRQRLRSVPPRPATALFARLEPEDKENPAKVA